MKTQDADELKWVGIDLHVHTPASKDYRGGRDASEYLRLVQTANQFTVAMNSSGKRNKTTDRNPIGCMAFTDHNSVDGFQQYRQLLEETENLSKVIRTRDPGNPLVSQLEKEMELFRSIRILMGVEVKADPGIHLLIIFSESVEASQVISFLEQVYNSRYEEFAGSPLPTSHWSLKQMLDKIHDTFAGEAIVVLPHIDSTGGVYEDLKEFGQARILALTHPIVRALSFNRLETREKMQELFGQPAYHRGQPVALIQSSDFHGEEGSPIGQPRTEVLVREGKATFKNLKECFRELGRVKCSIDFVAEDYKDVTRDRLVVKFTSDTGKFEFRECDFDRVAQNMCGLLNSAGGIIELEGDPAAIQEGKTPWTLVREQMAAILQTRLKPPMKPSLFRSFRFSPGKIRVVLLVRPSDRLYVVNGQVYITRADQITVATPSEIEFVVGQNLETRFGTRFEHTLDHVSKESSLLSRLPHGIPIILACATRITRLLPASFKVVEIDPLRDKSAEAEEVFDDLLRKENPFPFGNPEGNTTVLAESKRPRERDHYLRFTVRRAQLSEEVLAKCAWGRIDKSAIIVAFNGYVGLAEPGHIVSSAPAVLIQFDDDWQDNIFSLLSWFKSSFFIWYCAVSLGNASPFAELQWKPFRLPVPRKEHVEFLQSLAEVARTVMAAENEFMIDINRLKKKGTLDSEYQEKVRQRHNAHGNKCMLSIDKQIFDFLGLDDGDRRVMPPSKTGHLS